MMKRMTSSPASRSSLVGMLHDRERNSWHTGSRCYVNNLFLPNSVQETLATPDKLKYCSVFSPDHGRHMLVASIDGLVTVYNTEQGGYREVARYLVDQTNYSLLDLDVSPNGREFLCSTWRNSVYTCNVLEEDDINRNCVRRHQLADTASKMGVFSTCFNNDGSEILASCNNGCIYVFDRARNERSLRIVQDEREDINAVRFLERTGNNVIVGASNNGVIEIWDRRALGPEASQKPVATLVGHFDGVTYIDPKGDGRCFLTNSKDQSIKLWDVRSVSGRLQVKKARKLLANSAWNYMHDNIPPECESWPNAASGDPTPLTRLYFPFHRLRREEAPRRRLQRDDVPRPPREPDADPGEILAAGHDGQPVHLHWLQHGPRPALRHADGAHGGQDRGPLGPGAGRVVAPAPAGNRERILRREGQPERVRKEN